MSLSSVSPTLRQPIVGASDTIALLSQDSNNGFVLMRGTAFAAVRECLPWDEVYCRAKPADEWIDELLWRLRRQGQTVTLIPDLPAMPKGERSFFEVFQRGAARRAALAAMPAFGAGAVDTLIHRLGIDKAADAESRQLAMAHLDRLAEQTRVPSQDWSSEGGVLDPRLDQVVVAAFATGQIDLGKEVLAYLASLKAARHFNYANKVEKFWEGLVDDIHLAIMLDRGDCWDSNQKTPPSIAVEGGERAILLHATQLEDGVGRLVFELDLTGFNQFSSSVRTLSAEDRQVRFHLSIASKQGPLRFSKDCVASGSSPVHFDCSVPDELQGPCSVSLMAELRGEILSEPAVEAYWINPRFTRMRPS